MPSRATITPIRMGVLAGVGPGGGRVDAAGPRTYRNGGTQVEHPRPPPVETAAPTGPALLPLGRRRATSRYPEVPAMLVTPDALARRDGHLPEDIDPQETSEWIESMEAVLRLGGADRAQFLLGALIAQVAKSAPGRMSVGVTTPYVNTIPAEEQPDFPGDRALERRIKSIVRWNAMAMVVKANKTTNVGGHIATFASAATLYEIGWNHFFRGRTDTHPGDVVFYQGHASPGMYSRAFVEGRLDEAKLNNFRQELQPGGGLSSYPHPWLMPDFWQYPTVSMGLGPMYSALI
eukprot:Opistho-1_new@103644